MDDPAGRHWGYELSKRSGLRSGVLYPILHRLWQDGWLEDCWEEPLDVRGHRPPRRYYELTPDGRALISELVAEMRCDVRFAGVLGGG
jgi:PadR family transcriptional regulator PadR